MNKEELQKLIESKFESNREYLEHQGCPVDYLDKDNFTKAVKEILQELKDNKHLIEWRKQMTKLVNNQTDTEKDHKVADDILTEVLEIYGEHGLVRNYQLIGKWYA